MYKRTFKYTDFDENEREEDHYFNLTKAEVMKWLTTNGDYTLDALLMQLAKEHDGKKIMDMFETLIDMSYGEKSLDGRMFVKNKEILQKFKATEAYSDLFMELATDAKKAANFIRAILPKDLEKAIADVIAKNPEGLPDSLKDYLDDNKEEAT